IRLLLQMEETKKILIIADNEEAASSLKDKLALLHYEVLPIASSGEEGIELAGNFEPDLALIDIKMNGDRDGIAAAKNIRNDIGIPVIFIANNNDEDARRRAKAAGPYGYVTAPFNTSELQSAIELALYKNQTERKLIESEFKYRMLFMTATDPVLTLDVDGFITSYNAKTLEMFGYEADEIESKQIKLLLPDVFLNNLAEGAKRILDTGRPALGNMIETRARKKSGEFFPIELSFSKWELEGEVTFTLIIRDISLRRASEDALKKANEELETRVEERTAELKALIEQSPFPICVFDLQGEPVDGNKAWRLLRKNAPDVKAYNVFKDPVLERTGYIADVKKIFETGGSCETKPLFLEPDEFPYLGKPGGSLLIFHYYAVTNELGLVNRVVALVEDVTQSLIASEIKKELTEQKNISAYMLENLEEERRRISRELHDGIGQILFAAKFNLEVFEKNFNTENRNVAEAKNLISSANTELRNIIYSLHPAVIDNYGLKAALEMFLKEFMEVTSIKVDADLEDISIRFNPKIELSIFRIVQEIFNNIRKHSQASEADLSISNKNGLLAIRAKDNGKGFDIDANKKKSDRSSFGLMNIRQRVETLEGIFQIDSEPGQGARIFIEIPLRDNHGKN
ncbi:MAG TPA: PAS domain S-box protein, partial [Ignavibacteriales bacterium]|nr:PAS domain S-box protein [Ignavibacteriales bacterium]